VSDNPISPIEMAMQPSAAAPAPQAPASDAPSTNADTEAPAPSVQDNPAAARPLDGRLIAVALIAVVLGLAALVVAWQVSSQQRALERELVRRQEASQIQSGEADAAAKAALDQSRDSAAKVALLDARLAEVALQRSQLEELIQSMSRSRDENVLSDIDASLHVAMQQSGMTGSVEPLVSALKQADERLARYKQPRMEGVRRAVARDLDRVKAVSVVDLASLAIKLDEVERLMDEIPLLSEADKRIEPAPAGPRSPHGDKIASAPVRGGAKAVEQQGEWQQWWEWFDLKWADTWAQVWTEAKSLLRVTRIDHPEAILTTPSQSYFLRENIKLRLLNARLALLSRQFDTAQSDLRDTQAALERYFDARSRKQAVALDLLRQVAAQARQVIVPRPDGTLAAVAAAAH